MNKILGYIHTQIQQNIKGSLTAYGVRKCQGRGMVQGFHTITQFGEKWSANQDHGIRDIMTIQ